MTGAIHSHAGRHSMLPHAHSAAELQEDLRHEGDGNGIEWLLRMGNIDG